jgi:hypothetical protein
MLLAEEPTCPSRCASPPTPSRRARVGELSIKKRHRIIEETLIRRALEKTKGNRTQAVEAARDQPPRAALQDQGLRG